MSSTPANGDALRKFVMEIRRLCQDLSQLLETANMLVAEHGWEAVNNVAHAYYSAQVRNHHQWFPNELFQFYQDPTQPQIVAFIAVLLDDRKREYQNFREPLLTAGWFDYGPGKSVGQFKEYWYARFHAYAKERRDDGSWHSRDSDPSKERPFKRVSTLGIPLVEVTSADVLRERIVLPLVEGVSDAMSSLEARPSSVSDPAAA